MPTYQTLRKKTKRKEELKGFGFSKVFERVGGAGNQMPVVPAPGSSQGFSSLPIFLSKQYDVKYITGRCESNGVVIDGCAHYRNRVRYETFFMNRDNK
jgi:hypothetical protein